MLRRWDALSAQFVWMMIYATPQLFFDAPHLAANRG
jgi:hypothetical protein